MKRKYQPKHMKEREKMKLPIFSAKPVITAGLVGAMVAPSALAPASAIAAGSTNGTTAASGEIHRLIAETNYSEAAQRLIAAANGEVKMTLDEAKALLAEVQAAANAANATNTEAQGMKTSAGNAVANAEGAYNTADADAIFAL